MFLNKFISSSFVSICSILCKTPYLFSAESTYPENQIIIMEDFITSDVANILMKFYRENKKDLRVSDDNQIAISSITNSKIRKIIIEISTRVLKVMNQNYVNVGQNYHLDHGGLYARIAGNFCPYHADNVYFDCPIHGKNQGILREYCKGNCPNAKFVFNHTYWREYTALVYLNDDFDGGEISFEDGPCNKIYKKVIPIKRNMLILAPNGSDFYHEVFPIRRGTRYSIHLWYTSDPQHRLR